MGCIDLDKDIWSQLGRPRSRSIWKPFMYSDSCHAASQRYRSTVLQFYSSTVLQFYSSTVLQFYSSTVLQFYSSTTQNGGLNLEWPTMATPVKKNILIWILM
jgi:hypothetical protein